MNEQALEELSHTHMNYPGYRAKLAMKFGSMKDSIQIDIGVGDVVREDEITWKSSEYRGQALFENSISLQAYPIETIFSEKLETLVSRGGENSRMKDFHDILLMCRKENLLDKKKLKQSIDATFENRKTIVNLPLIFIKSETERLQRYWLAHLRTLNSEIRKELNLPEKISDLIEEVNKWLIKLL